MDAFVAAAIGFVAAALLAMVNSWLSGREQVEAGVRDRRIASYPAVWERTAVVSKWPRTDAGPAELLRLHEDLRQWYYAGGGLYLSSHARAKYEHLQVVLDAVLSSDEIETTYALVRDAASYFRTGLTDDLETRERRSLLVTLERRKADRGAKRKADARLRSLGIDPRAAWSGTGRGPVHAVTPAEQELRLDGTTPTG
ncbi:hypothetical protein ASC77_05085 [Nocardioides sp. Root1257]|uniref:hypothetical protein n=1 Tax=unclassified Nocardioides TaxID=2615069 RepID=UPI0006F54FD4|nr:MULTISPECIES: hypothetical protein [unclassified Nocardioides]KQW53644.1 hypothetical protein ASC77_05085 [Nocardioides sp. Root1257]KRC56330.1 hypothetical protein ASE24_05085 [Nocardioides sp. Root224]